MLVTIIDQPVYKYHELAPWKMASILPRLARLRQAAHVGQQSGVIFPALTHVRRCCVTPTGCNVLLRLGGEADRCSSRRAIPSCRGPPDRFNGECLAENDSMLCSSCEVIRSTSGDRTMAALAIDLMTYQMQFSRCKSTAVYSSCSSDSPNIPVGYHG
jgi:hypothetical protein